ncbi:MAG: DUF1592 domain-containing protein [Verrucomicrobiota bacterium]
MSRFSPPVLGLLAATVTLPLFGATDPLPFARIPHSESLLINDHCVDCHGPKKQKGNFRIDELDLSISSIAIADRWNKVLNQVRNGEMPPENEKQPNDALKADFVKSLSMALAQARNSLPHETDRTKSRRLNRREYHSTIQALTGLDVADNELPPDSDSGFFDTVLSSTPISTDLFAQYKSLATQIAERLLTPQEFGARPVLKRHSEPEENTNKQIATTLENIDKAYARYTEWATTRGHKSPKEFKFKDEADAKHAQAQYELLHQYLTDYLALPLKQTGAYLTTYAGNPTESIAALSTWPTGKYIVRITIAALDDSPEKRRFIEFGQHGEDRSEFTVLSGHHVTGTLAVPQVIEIPVTIGLTGSREFSVREKQPANPALVKEAFAEYVKKNGTGPAPALWINSMEIESAPPNAAPQSTSTALGTTAPAMGLPGSPATGKPQAEDLSKQLLFKGPPFIEVLPKASSYQKNLEYAREILSRFATRAFRGRYIDAEFIDSLVKHYEAKRDSGAPFEAALKEPFTIILSAPEFLYLTDPPLETPEPPKNAKNTPPLKPEPINLWHVWSDAKGAKVEAELLDIDGDIVTVRLRTGETPKLNLGKLVPENRAFAEKMKPHLPFESDGARLASRLSYLLWSEPPDTTLLSLGTSGELLRPTVLDQQINRLLTDSKASKFVSAFVGQWFDLDRLNNIRFNAKAYQDFDNATKLAAKNEVIATVTHVLTTGGNISQLLKSEYIIGNAILANYYGIKGVSGDEFRKIPIPAGSPRGGLLGMAGILALGSNGERTKAVDRGAWVLRKILHEPLRAPTNVPELSRLDSELLTTRERLKAHEDQPQCVTCHRKIDPIGLGLENFDAAGNWRTQDNYEKAGVGKKSWDIDPSGTFHKGAAFKDFQSLRDIIAAKPDLFAQSFIEALLEYIQGRPCGFMDVEMIENIMLQARAKNFALSEIVRAIIHHPRFNTR